LFEVPYSYFQLYDVPAARQTEIKKLLDHAHNYSALRNNIAHALWVAGTRPKTIRAGYIDIRHGRGHIAGYDEDDKDYTMDELGDIANELISIANNLIRYLRDSGISADISRKIQETNKVI